MSYRFAVAVAAALSLAGAAESRAQKLDKEQKKWLDGVRPIMLPDEEKTFKDLKDKADREEFQKIFWTRRDPDLETPENEFQDAYQAAKAEVDTLYKIAGRPGSETDCGRVHLLLGKPDEVQQDKSPSETPAFRSPEVWTFRDRPGQTFTGGQAQISFEANCALPQGGRLGEQLIRVAEGKIIHPNLGYKRTPEGKLVKLVDQLPKPSPALSLLKAPRTDFPLTAEPSLVLKTEDGATYVAGLVRGDASGLTLQDAGGKKTAKVVVAAQATDAAGKAAIPIERPLTVEVGPDNHFLASFGMALKPGDYTIRVGAVDSAGKGSAVSFPFKSPSLNTEEVSISPLVLLQDFQEGAKKDPLDPLADFAMAAGKLVPRYGNVFTKADAITILGQIYSPKLDEAGKPNVTSTFTILKDGKPVAKAAEQTGTMAAVGPVPLGEYTPGKYVVQLKVKDNLGQKESTQEASFEVK
jgi:GWxTD domain-containing protein